MSDPIQVTTTLPTREEALRMAAALVERRLAACVQVVGPVSSTYWWQGKIETAEEWQCIAKSRSGLYQAIEAAICELHSYDTPEVLATPILAGHARYLQWLNDELRPAE
jgi:periplasmic divalent cation tolerance protein